MIFKGIRKSPSNCWLMLTEENLTFCCRSAPVMPTTSAVYTDDLPIA